MDEILRLKNLSVNDGEKTILYQTSLMVKDQGITAIMGPMGSGKSTLLALLEQGGQITGLQTRFEAGTYCGKPLGSIPGPVVIRQKPRGAASDLHSRLAELYLACATGEAMLCIDEPTAGLSRKDGQELMRQLAEIARQKAVLLISHNAEEVREYCDEVLLFASGRVVEALPVKRFFNAPENSHAARFLRTGGLDIPYETTPARSLAPENRATPSGYDLGPSSQTHGAENWVIPDVFSLIDLPTGPSGQPDPASLKALTPQRCVFHLSNHALEIYDPDSHLQKLLPWDGVALRPEHNPRLAASICYELENQLVRGQRITLNSGHLQNSAAAILGAFLILKSFPPQLAFETVAKKFPSLHLGMRVEGFLWDMDVEFSMKTGQ